MPGRIAGSIKYTPCWSLRCVTRRGLIIMGSFGTKQQKIDLFWGRLFVTHWRSRRDSNRRSVTEVEIRFILTTRYCYGRFVAVILFCLFWQVKLLGEYYAKVETNVHRCPKLMG